MSDLENETKKKLNSTSPTLCLAKWKQVTLHLESGLNHSCHHPIPHKTPVDELAGSPSALHNTKFKKLQRKLMLEGKRPQECDYCWKIEDLDKNLNSDRILKSSDPWALPYFDEIVQNKWSKDINPSYLEVSFSHKCNFKCIYCFPNISSAWQKEIEKFGPYQLSYQYNDIEIIKGLNGFPIPEKNNPFIQAFWKWIPDLLPSLHTLRVTGGEPLLSPSTSRLLDFISLGGYPNLDLAINSNLGVPNLVLKKSIDKIKETLPHIKRFSFYTSLDAAGSEAEYIRTGLSMDIFSKNLLYVAKQLPDIQITIMCTISLLSIPNIKNFMIYILGLKRQLKEFRIALIVDINILRNPSFLSIEILNGWGRNYVASAIDFMKTNQDENGFLDFELNKMTRLLESMTYVQESLSHKVKKEDFKKYINQLDHRRNTNFKNIFPSLSFLMD